MQMEFLQSEQNAIRRRWILVLVDSTDGVTGKTGQTGTVEISKNGLAPAASTNSIVEVDSVNMPGHYYVEFVASELDTLGPISIYYKSSGTLAFHDRGFVTYNDPYAAVGIMASSGAPAKPGFPKEQIKSLLADIRQIIKEEIDAAEQNEVEEEEKSIDFTPILKAINKIEKPKDYSAELTKIAVQINAFGLAHKIDVEGFSKAVSDFQLKFDGALKAIESSESSVEDITLKFGELQKAMDGFQKTLVEQSDMDKRFDSMNSASSNEKISALSKTINDFMIKVIDIKYDILKELAKQKTKK